MNIVWGYVKSNPLSSLIDGLWGRHVDECKRTPPFITVDDDPVANDRAKIGHLLDNSVQRGWLEGPHIYSFRTDRTDDM
jgi:hypothetical protein